VLSKHNGSENKKKAKPKDFYFQLSIMLMRSAYQRWLKLFLFSFGIALASSFIMQWLAGDFWLGDEKFSILGLELFYSKKDVIKILTEVQLPARLALHYQLIFDFAFMAGVYPAIASLCMMAREKLLAGGTRNFLFALAILQPVAWAFDVTENIYLLHWLSKPEIGDEFGMYHNIVAAKWIIALLGFFSAIVLLALKKRIPGSR
jgi:hypothetical protein